MNSTKYAFSDKRKGEIVLDLKSNQDVEFELIYSDNGVGIPDEVDWRNSKSLGLKLVRTLVEKQLKGSIEMDSNNGTKFIIKFKTET